MSTLLSLGKVDQGAMPARKDQFLSLYHAELSPDLQKMLKFRDEANKAWCDFEEVSGTGIHELQQFLKDAGFMPKANIDGIFGYATQAAVRLFQEYVRTVDNDPTIGAPDGTAGPNTLNHIETWKQKKKGTAEFVCEWGRANARNASQEFNQWIGLLSKAKQHYLNNPNPIVAFVDAFNKPTDTRKLKDWDTSPDTIHLLGIRRGQDASLSGTKRDNDDLFVLLINGMVFKFWGSTDPNPDLAKRSDIPFLVEGQHNYKFGWHKNDEGLIKLYRALRPKSSGVLVFRDKNADKALTPEDIVKGLDPDPNTTINIHWSGVGSYNFSAGCQVIAGKSYINHKNMLIDCTDFAAGSYDELGVRNKSGDRKGRAAYNVFADLVLTYAPPGVQSIVYTLGNDDTLFLSDVWNENFVKETVEKMKNARH